MIRRTLLFLALAVLPSLAQATVADDIRTMEADRTARAAQGRPLLPLGFPQRQVSRMMTLQDGRQVNLNDYAVVVFMQQHCPWSAKFDPKLKAWADQQGVRVYAYTLDGYGDAAFPVPLIPRKAGPGEPLAGEILTFFGNGLPIATPTSFMVNVTTNAAYPLIQGDTDMGTFSGRMAQMMDADVDHLSPNQLGPVPSGAGTTAQ